jgi:hypothetical protein
MMVLTLLDRSPWGTHARGARVSLTPKPHPPLATFPYRRTSHFIVLLACFRFICLVYRRNPCGSLDLHLPLPSISPQDRRIAVCGWRLGSRHTSPLRLAGRALLRPRETAVATAWLCADGTCSYAQLAGSHDLLALRWRTRGTGHDEHGGLLRMGVEVGQTCAGTGLLWPGQAAAV